MAIVRRKDAVIGAQIDVRVRFRNDKTGQVQVPYEITKVQILDSDASTVLEDNITAITALAEDWFKVVTSNTWNTAAKNVFDRWFYRMEAGGPLLQHIESTTIATGLVCSDTEEKIGYAFDNYSVPAGEWGVAGTPDDLRFHWLYGIDLVAQNRQEVADTQLKYVIDQAVSWVETRLGIDIRKKIYITNQKTTAPNAVRGKIVKAGVDFTDHEDNYPFRPQAWKQFGFTQLRHYPILSIERAGLYGITHTLLIDMLDARWVSDLRIEKEAGQVYAYPLLDSFIYGPPEAGSGFSLLWLRYAQNQYPGGFEFDYTTGYETSDFMPEILREVIMKVACIATLQWTGDGLLAGFSSSSISLDGLSESFSSTQSATSAFFGARLLSLQSEVKEWMKHNRFKFSNVAISFA